MSDRGYLTYEEAVAMLPDGDTIHTFSNPVGVLLGVDFDRKTILEYLRKGEPELAGECATDMNHGIAVTRQGYDGFLFIETKETDDA